MNRYYQKKSFIEEDNSDNLKEQNIDIVVTRLKAFIIDDKEEIYLATSGGGCQLPGGHLEDGESVLEGLKREIKEEIGICLDDNEIIGEFYRKKYFKKNYKNTRKNRLSQIIYYIVKTNKLPDISNVNLTSNEIINKYSFTKIPITKFETYVKSFLYDTQTEINISIIQELLKAFSYLNQIYN